MPSRKPDRSPRSETRTQEIREDGTWVYPAAQAGDKKIPEEFRDEMKAKGFHLRWIRFKLNGEADIKNIQKRVREGFMLVKADEVASYMPHIEILPKFGRLDETDLVVDGDLALAKIPLFKLRARQQYFGQVTKAKSDAIDQMLGKASVQGTPHMPIYNDSSSRVTTGGKPATGQRPSTTFADDAEVEMDLD